MRAELSKGGGLLLSAKRCLHQSFQFHASPLEHLRISPIEDALVVVVLKAEIHLKHFLAIPHVAKRDRSGVGLALDLDAQLLSFGRKLSCHGDSVREDSVSVGVLHTSVGPERTRPRVL